MFWGHCSWRVKHWVFRSDFFKNLFLRTNIHPCFYEWSHIIQIFGNKIPVFQQNTYIAHTIKIYGLYLQMLINILNSSQLILSQTLPWGTNTLAMGRIWDPIKYFDTCSNSEGVNTSSLVSAILISIFLFFLSDCLIYKCL